jgi:hypothetical protein
VSKTFLFLGFSFSDPNLDYILSRIRLNFNTNQRQHYCLFKKSAMVDYSTTEEYEYAKLKQELAIKDLERFNVTTLLIDDYHEITFILQTIENRLRNKTVFISGSAYEYGELNSFQAQKFIADLSSLLIRNGNKVVSGFGIGVGSHVITGALQEIYTKPCATSHNQLILRPFPQDKQGQEFWEEYRKDMVSYAGIAIFVFGNKLNEAAECLLADGVRKEFDIAKKAGLKLIPIAFTGFMAKELHAEIMANFEQYYPSKDHIFKEIFDSLGNSNIDPAKHITTILDIIAKLK